MDSIVQSEMKAEAIPNNTVHRHRTNIRCCIADGGSRQEEGEVLALNKAGVRISTLSMATGPRAVRQFFDKEYGIIAETLEGNLQGFLTKLEEAGIIGRMSIAHSEE